jgi:CDP-diacylglycerol---glycerol-3-phosphate 3-phosphatidyltransferase
MISLNLAQWITVARVLLLPLAVLPVVLDHEAGWLACAGVSALAGLSDFADGYVARRKRQETLLGQKLDLLSDKLFVGSLLIFMSVYGLVGFWVPAVVLLREAAVFWLRAQSPQPQLQQPDFLGKLKTTASYVAIVWTALFAYRQTGGSTNPGGIGRGLTSLLSLSPWIMLAAVCLTVLSGLNYFRKYCCTPGAGSA